MMFLWVHHVTRGVLLVKQMGLSSKNKSKPVPSISKLKRMPMYAGVMVAFGRAHCKSSADEIGSF